MRTLLTYESFVANQNIIETRRELMINIFKQFDEIKPIMNEAELLVESGLFDDGFESINEENLISKMKAKFDNAMQVAKAKGKEALTDAQEKIIKLGGNIGNIIKLMVEKLKEWVTSLFTAATSHFKSAAASKSGEIKKAVEGSDKKKITIEVKNLKDITAATAKWATSGFVQDTTKAAATAAKEDIKEAFELAVLQSINEAVISGELDFTDMVEESEGGIPFISAIAHKMHHIPPFSLLDKVKQGAEKVASGVLNKLSYYANKLAGAPGPYEFVALAAIIGIIAEVQFKGIAKHALLSAVPGLGMIASIISNTAMALAVIGIIESLMDKEGEGHDEKSH
jgi:hypothetical protein